ncbi:DUF4166 domain-containing protein [Microbacterium aoyamense]|uniref:DUF4166 domain-containing protein n=1 Tax=Microbacterium aoyamense TaxID=344166 RepID=A0ABN2PID5_9MICO|nr:DUF4166 domain-containing protein [Microbacterium aoyamense]
MTTSESVYERVLGERFAAIHPALRAYFGALPPGTVGVGHGTFAEAGSRLRFLRPMLTCLARRGILFPERGTDVPFTVVNTATRRGTLTATRTFRFPARERVLVDEMSIAEGRLIDRVGRGGRLEIALDVLVVDEGVRLRSRRLALRLAGRRIPLPHAVRVTVDERAVDGGQHVDVRLRSPLLGEVFRYVGAFTYTHAEGLSATEGS